MERSISVGITKPQIVAPTAQKVSLSSDDLTPNSQDRIAQIADNQIACLEIIHNERGGLLIVSAGSTELEMDPALRTEIKDGLDFEAGRRGLALITTARKILGQGRMQLQSGTILN